MKGIRIEGSTPNVCPDSRFHRAEALVTSVDDGVIVETLSFGGSRRADLGYHRPLYTTKVFTKIGLVGESCCLLFGKLGHIIV